MNVGIIPRTGLGAVRTGTHQQGVEGFPFWVGRERAGFWPVNKRAELADGPAVHVRCARKDICSLSFTNLLSVAEHVACT